MKFRLSLYNETYDSLAATIIVEINAEEIDPDEENIHILHPSDIKQPRVFKTKSLEIGEEILSHIAKACGLKKGERNENFKDL